MRAVSLMKTVCVILFLFLILCLFTQKMEFFHDRYARLDEVLKAQKLNDADYKFFIDYTY